MKSGRDVISVCVENNNFSVVDNLAKQYNQSWALKNKTKNKTNYKRSWNVKKKASRPLQTRTATEQEQHQTDSQGGPWVMMVLKYLNGEQQSADKQAASDYPAQHLLALSLLSVKPSNALQRPFSWMQVDGLSVSSMPLPLKLALLRDMLISDETPHY